MSLSMESEVLVARPNLLARQKHKLVHQSLEVPSVALLVSLSPALVLVVRVLTPEEVARRALMKTMMSLSMTGMKVSTVVMIWIMTRRTMRIRATRMATAE